MAVFGAVVGAVGLGAGLAFEGEEVELVAGGVLAVGADEGGVGAAGCEGGGGHGDVGCFVWVVWGGHGG